MGRRSNKDRTNERGKAKASGLHRGFSIGSLAFVIAVVTGGPIGTVLQKVDVITALLFLFAVIIVSIVADIVAVAATAAKDVPFNAMASDRVPGAQEALLVVRNAGKVNSIFADIIGDIAGTISGVVATPLIFLLSDQYPGVPPVILSALVIGVIAFFTIGGKAAEKDFAVRKSTVVILWVGKVIYVYNRLKALPGKDKQKHR